MVIVAANRMFLTAVHIVHITGSDNGYCSSERNVSYSYSYC